MDRKHPSVWRECPKCKGDMASSFCLAGFGNNSVVTWRCNDREPIYEEWTTKSSNQSNKVKGVSEVRQRLVKWRAIGCGFVLKEAS